jgi:hypothetical protein
MSDPTPFLACVLIGLVISWIVANPAGWALTYRRDGDPFNWRIWLGPAVYHRWAVRQEGP